MKKGITLFLLTLFMILCAVEALSQNRSHIIVRGNQLNSGVVILDIARAGKTFRLQCNREAAGCTALKNDKYVLVELPENFGMYECKCVELYPENAVDQKKDRDKKLGEYCLIEK